MSGLSEPTRVVALAASAELGGTERIFIDFAARAFEHDIVLGVITPRDGPLVGILRELGMPTDVLPAPRYVLRGSQRTGHLWSAPFAVFGLARWAQHASGHEFWRTAHAVYSVSFKTHLATAFRRDRPVVWHLHEFPPRVTGPAWKLLARRVPDRLIANSEAAGRAWTTGGRATLSVIPNGVDLDRFKPRPRSFWIHDRLGIPHGHRVIGMPAVFARDVSRVIRDASRATMS